MAAGVLALLLTSSVAGVVRGGSLDPPGSVFSTMKSLDDVTPIWNRLLSASSPDTCESERFQCVFDSIAGSEGVLDRETGLVWQRNLNANTAQTDLTVASQTCINAGYAGRKGWRLPTAAEFGSLLDATIVSPELSLPPGHPFIGIVQGSGYWTSTLLPASTTTAYVGVPVFTALPGFPGGITTFAITSMQPRIWCVRGPAAQ
jgi:hypothetical protein